jgi:hypothetical protein
MAVKCNANEGKGEAKKKEDIPHKCTQFDLRRMSHVARIPFEVVVLICRMTIFGDFFVSGRVTVKGIGFRCKYKI